jgi:hypothetical protein
LLSPKQKDFFSEKLLDLIADFRSILDWVAQVRLNASNTFSRKGRKVKNSLRPQTTEQDGNLYGLVLDASMANSFL